MYMVGKRGEPMRLPGQLLPRVWCGRSIIRVNACGNNCGCRGKPNVTVDCCPWHWIDIGTREHAVGGCQPKGRRERSIRGSGNVAHQRDQKQGNRECSTESLHGSLLFERSGHRHAIRPSSKFRVPQNVLYLRLEVKELRPESCR